MDDHLRAAATTSTPVGMSSPKPLQDTATATFESTTSPLKFWAIPRQSVLQRPVRCPRIARVGISAAEAAGNSDYQIAQIPYGKLTGTKGPHEVAAEMTVVLDAAHHGRR